MGSGIKGVAFAAAGFMFLAQGAHAWYGPICYSDRTTQLVLTIPSISGESPGDLKVDFDDNDGKVRLGVVRASAAVKNAHEVVLVRDAESQNGVFAVVVTSPRSTTGYKFELEFRKDASECAGAIIKATDRAGGGLLAQKAPAASSNVTLAAAHVKRPRAPKPKSSPSPAPADENAVASEGSGASADEIVKTLAETPVSASSSSSELKPLPTPSAGSEAPAVHEPAQQAGEAPKAESARSEAKTDAPAEAPKSEATATPSEAGSEAPATAPATVPASTQSE